MLTSMKLVIVLLVMSAATIAPASAQDKVFDWVQANSEAVRLDPGYYHAGHVYRPGPDGGNLHVDIEAEKPVTIALAPETEWNEAMQHSERLQGLSFLCMQEHVVKTTYTCHIPAQAMVLVIRDERAGADHAIDAGLHEMRRSDDAVERVAAIGIGTVLTGSGSVTHRFVSPNDLHIQYYAWHCIENCYQAEFRWFEAAKEKYQLTAMLKVYSGIFPDHDGEQVSVKIKSPVPMAVAVIPSAVANQLYGNAGIPR